MKKQERQNFNQRLFEIATMWDTKSEICMVEGCETSARSRNLCAIHYRNMNRVFGQILKYRDLDEYKGILPPYSKQPRRCIHDDCTTRPIQRGLCGLHYNRWRIANNKPVKSVMSAPIDKNDLWEFVKAESGLTK